MATKKRTQRKRRQHSDDFHAAAVKRVHDGETVAAVASDLDIGPNLLRSWMRNPGPKKKSGRRSPGAIATALVPPRASTPSLLVATVPARMPAPAPPGAVPMLDQVALLQGRLVDAEAKIKRLQGMLRTALRDELDLD